MTKEDKSIAIEKACREAMKIKATERTVRLNSMTRENKNIKSAAKKYGVSFSHVNRIIK